MLEVYCDGGSRGNPGHAAWGFIVKADGKTIKKSGGYIGIATNNFAEYTAVVEALNWLKENYPKEVVNFYLDSKLVVSQLNGLFKIKNAAIRDFVFKIRTLENGFSKLTYSHVPREKNHDADSQVNLALDQKLYGTV